MEKLVDNQWYSLDYNGNIIPDEELDKWLTMASNKVRMSILNRDITGYEAEVSNCTCQVADILYNQFQKNQELIKGNITSEKVGDYSRSFSTTSSDELTKTCNSQILNSLELWLGPTGLMYRGLDV